MKLLFDQNLSSRLVQTLQDLYPGSTHVKDVGLESADDALVWEYAKAQGFAITSKDFDFWQFSFTLGQPPRSCGFNSATARRRKWKRHCDAATPTSLPSKGTSTNHS